MYKRLLLALAAIAMAIGLARAADLVNARDGSGVFGYKDTPLLPNSKYHVHDPDRPLPRRVEGAAVVLPPPSDAAVLFDGKDASAWQGAAWKVVEGCIEAGEGAFSTRQSFGSFQLHLEYMGPKDFKGPWYNQGNNGVLLHGLYEIQIFDSLNIKLYPDGMAGAIYGQTPPLVNACLAPGQWQSFDITLTAPVFDGDKLLQPARATVLHNGVLVQHDQPILGPTGHRILPAYAKPIASGPLVLGGHGCPVRFRNIWIRPVEPAAN